MTLEYLEPNGPFTDAIKFTINTPDLPVGPVTQYTLNISSRYENQAPIINTVQISLPLTVNQTNDRYTEFVMDYDPQIGDADLSGMYNYEVVNQTSTVIDAGLLKIQNNQEQSVQNAKKHVGPNDSAKSYVII